jgi:uncharacterized protein (TIGR02231 family)
MYGYLDMSVFFDNNYVCTTKMKNVSPGEEFEAFLGNDENIMVEYSVPHRFRQTKGLIMSNNKQTITSKVVVRNNKPTPVLIEVKDRVPISQNENITVKLVEPVFPNTNKDNKEKLEVSNVPLLPKESKLVAQKATLDVNNKLVTWEMSIPANTKVIIPMSHELEWPTSYDLQYRRKSEKIG